MITLFSIPKAFKDHASIIQTNALRSWASLSNCKVILFGVEQGIEEISLKLGLQHIPQISLNEYGTPLVSDAFRLARIHASTPLLAYVNADIVLDRSFLRAAQALANWGKERWLVAGQRHDLAIQEALDFSEGWEDRLHREVNAHASLHGPSGLDYFLFPTTMDISMPSFAVGRPGWDNWLLYHIRASGLPLVDASAAVLAVHQNHPPAYSSFETEARANTRAAGGLYHMATLRDADWRLTIDAENGLELRPRPLGRWWFSPPLRGLLTLKRRFQSWRGQHQTHRTV